MKELPDTTFGGEANVMKFLDLQVTFMIPLWRRVLLVLFCFIWSVVEYLNGATFWAAVFVSIAVYAVWQLFLDDWPASEQASEDNSSKSADSSTTDDELGK